MMSHQPPQRSRANRSNRYSESRCTNLGRFNPYYSELFSMQQRYCTRSVLRPGGAHSVRIIEVPLNDRFLRPYDKAAIEGVLETLPPQHLRDLNAIYLLGGTAKQDKCALSRLFPFGCYQPVDVFLFPVPRRLMRWTRKGPPAPHFVQQYTRAGASVRTEGDRWICEFNESSLARFYLCDVLPHEIAHHIDRHNAYDKSYDQAERFAEAYVQRYQRRSSG